MKGVDKYLLTLLIFTSILAIILVQIQSKIGVYYWDIFFYLNNAAKMAGIGASDTLYLPPFLSYLTSLIFKLGYVSETALFIVSAIFYVLGVIALYLILKLKFSEVESFLGATAFATFTLIIMWAVSGALDVPSISLALWSLYFVLLGVKKNSRYLYFVFPVAVLSFLTRYTSALIIFPLILTFYIYKERIDIKKIVASIGIGVFIYYEFYEFLKQFGQKNIVPFIKYSTGGAVSSTNPGYNLDFLYYLKYIPQYISAKVIHNYEDMLWPSNSEPTLISYLILIFIIIGIIPFTFKNPKKYLLPTILAIVLALSIYFNFPFYIAEFIMFGMILSLYRNLKDKRLALDLIFLTWFLSFFILHTLHPVKVDRYFITMTPALAYAFTLGVHKFSKVTKIKNIATVLLTLIIFNTGIYLIEMPKSDPWVQSEKLAAEWLKKYDPDYKYKIIASDRGPAFTWYLKKYVFTRIYSESDKELFWRLMNKAPPYYYIHSDTSKSVPLHGYYPIKKIGQVVIYKREM